MQFPSKNMLNIKAKNAYFLSEDRPELQKLYLCTPMSDSWLPFIRKKKYSVFTDHKYFFPKYWGFAKNIKLTKH